MSSPGRPLKVLIITQFYYPDVTACAFRMQETAALLAEMGCEVHVIAGEPHKGQIDGQIIDDGRIKVSRVPLLKYEGRGKWNYIAHYLSFMFGAIRAAGRHKGHFDVIWASSPPLFTGIAGLITAWCKRAPLCLDIRDIWPESAVVAGQIKEGSFLFRAARLLNTFYRAPTRSPVSPGPWRIIFAAFPAGDAPKLSITRFRPRWSPTEPCRQTLNLSQ
ncbi:hypothetical protein MASR1M12_21230 [Erysipelotrichia bacterium]